MDPNMPAPQPPQPENVVPTAPVQTDPGKAFGILSIALCWLAWVATIIGIVGLVKSRKAGFKNTPAIIGIVLSLIFFIIDVAIVTSLTVEFFKEINSTSLEINRNEKNKPVADASTIGSLKVYRDTKIGMEIKVPANWRTQTNSSASTPVMSSGSSQITLNDNGGTNRDTRIGTIVVSCPATKRTLTVSEFTETLRQLNDQSVKAQSESETWKPFRVFTINGKPAVQSESVYSGLALKEREQNTYILVDDGDTICRIIVKDNNFNEPGPDVFEVADDVANSFKRI